VALPVNEVRASTGIAGRSTSYVPGIVERFEPVVTAICYLSIAIREFGTKRWWCLSSWAKRRICTSSNQRFVQYSLIAMDW